jgi:glucose-6-phosphate 1-dehydrogenase
MIVNTTPTPRNPLRDPRDRRLPLIAGPSSMVMFGVTGDLARKKLLPAIYDLANRGLLPPSFGLVGYGRREWSHEDFADYVRKSVTEHARTEFDESTFEQLAGGLRFVTGTFDDTAAFQKLTEVVEELDRTRGTGGNHAFYLSIPPDAFPQVCSQLANSGLNTPRDGSWRRVVIEKPFGHDLESAK